MIEGGVGWVLGGAGGLIPRMILKEELVKANNLFDCMNALLMEISLITNCLENVHSNTRCAVVFVSALHPFRRTRT